MRQRIGINDTCHELYEYAVSDASDGPQNFEVEHRKKLVQQICVRSGGRSVLGKLDTIIPIYEVCVLLQ